MTPEFARSLLGERRDLLRAVIALNGLASRPLALSGEGLGPLWERARRHPLLGRRLQPIREGVLWEFEKVENRFALLSAEQCEALERTLSAIICARHVACALDREAVLEWRRALGVDLYRLAVGRGLLYADQALRAALLPSSPDPHSDQDVKRPGQAALAMVAERADPQYESLIKFTGKRAYARMPSGQEGLYPRILALVVKVLLIEVAPSCRSLFTA
ncbi:MAG: hypothetical protein K6A65_03625 [Succinivibrionaceae bacterium]|nr:hypothetical protein [Succinivibrionaceae bacterium]